MFIALGHFLVANLLTCFMLLMKKYSGLVNVQNFQAKPEVKIFGWNPKNNLSDDSMYIEK